MSEQSGVDEHERGHDAIGLARVLAPDGELTRTAEMDASAGDMLEAVALRG
jgi:hypothetical protein